MDLFEKHIVITGAASGIGKALAEHFCKLKAKVILADSNESRLISVADTLGCSHFLCDVKEEKDIIALISRANAELGYIDLFCSNAGIFFKDEVVPAPLENKNWNESWHVNVMSHVYVARHLLPQMVKRQSGYFLQVISAAALLSQIGATAYSATKSAALSFAESLAISYGQKGIKVSAVCPQYVATPMLGFDDEKKSFQEVKNLISPDEAAVRIVQGVIQEKFLIFTDPGAKKILWAKM